MKVSAIYRIVLLTLLLHISYGLNAQISGFNRIKWEREKIAPGLVWKSAHTVLNDSVLQNINLLIVNPKRRTLSLWYEPGKNSELSKQALKAGAIAAVNAGFFNIKDGGSVTYVRAGGVIADSDTAKIWTRNSNMTGSLLLDRDGNLFIETAHPNSWYDNHSEYTEVLVTGPLLLSGKMKMQLPATPLVVNMHPRTVVGKRSNRRIVLLTLDGRTDQAMGMTLYETAELMKLLRCKDAVNLDGGGSTTMWISGKPFNGVVNMPCDNKKFDHEGERPVSDIIIIK
jgi:exopolysaccharide biosynthesis protein